MKHFINGNLLPSYPCDWDSNSLHVQWQLTVTPNMSFANLAFFAWFSSILHKLERCTTSTTFPVSTEMAPTTASVAHQQRKLQEVSIVTPSFMTVCANSSWLQSTSPMGKNLRAAQTLSKHFIILFRLVYLLGTKGQFDHFCFSFQTLLITFALENIRKHYVVWRSLWYNHVLTNMMVSYQHLVRSNWQRKKLFRS